MPPNRHRRTKAAAVQAAVATAQIPKPNGRIPAIANEDATQPLRAAIAATEADAKRQGKTNLELLQERLRTKNQEILEFKKLALQAGTHRDEEDVGRDVVASGSALDLSNTSDTLT